MALITLMLATREAFTESAWLYSGDKKSGRPFEEPWPRLASPPGGFYSSPPGKIPVPPAAWHEFIHDKNSSTTAIAVAPNWFEKTFS